MSVYVNHYTYGKQLSDITVVKSLINKDMIEFSWKRINKESILHVTFFYRFLILRLLKFQSLLVKRIVLFTIKKFKT